MPKRMGEDPLGLVGSEEEETEKRPEKPETNTPAAPDEKVRMTFYVPKHLAERLRNAVYWHGPSTLSGLAEEGLTGAIEKLEDAHGPFKQRPEDLKGGRPVGS